MSFNSLKLLDFSIAFTLETDKDDNRTMRNISHFLIQWLILGLVWNPVFAQEAGSATQDIANKYKYKEFIHQDTVDAYEKECENLKGGCNPNAPTQNGIDVVNSVIAKLAMGVLVGGGIAELVNGFNLKVSKSDALKKKNMQGKIAKYAKEGKTDKAQKLVNFDESAKGEQLLDNDKVNSKDAEDSGGLGKICKLVATAGTMGLTIADLMAKNNAEKKYKKADTEIAQTEALYTIANNHDQNRKSNVAQASIFGTVAVCYGIAAAIEYTPYGDKKKAVEYTVYAGLAGTLASLSGISADRHAETRDKATEAAARIPQKGNCHPGTPCFCAEKREKSEEFHNAEYEKNCVLDELQRGDSTLIGMACINGQGQPDPACNCKKNNTCLDETIKKEIQGLNLDNKLKAHLADSFNIVTNGSLSGKQADLISKRANVFQKIAEKNAEKLLNGQSIKPGDSELASAYQSNGMSPVTAAIASSAKLSPAAKAKLAKITGTTMPSRYARTGSNKKKSYHKAQQPNFAINYGVDDLFKKLTEEQKTAEIDPAERLKQYKRIRAQKRAMAMAEINPLENEPIFDIISQRYLKSGFIKIEN